MSIAVIAVLICVCVLWWRHQAPKRAYAKEYIRPLKEELRKAEQQLKVRKAADDLRLTEEERLARGMRNTIAGLDHQLKLFGRDFSSEIQQAKRTRSKGYERLDELSEEISQAYKELNEAKDALDRWIRKSKGTFIGNGGKKIPKSAIFGQSLNQRDSLKAARDRAYKKVRSLKAAKGEIYSQEIDAAKKRLAEIRKDIATLDDLKKQGVRPNSLRAKLREEKVKLAAVEAQIETLRAGQTRETLAAKKEVSRIKDSIKLKWKDYKIQKKSAA